MLVKDPKNTIVIIPAEGDSVETEQLYITKLREHYRKQGIELRILVFEYGRDRCEPEDVARSAYDFFHKHSFELGGYAEIHAQGGFGASVAYRMLALCSHLIHCVFFIGGAPGDAMPGIAKLFHLYFSRLWYASRVPFFADDPNPTRDPEIEQVRMSSTLAMRANPLCYRNQLVHLATWRLQEDWRAPRSCRAFFVPNGETVRQRWRDNSFNNELAAKIWAEHGVVSTRQPGDNFSFYNMMPTEALFSVMDEVRELQAPTI